MAPMDEVTDFNDSGSKYLTILMYGIFLYVELMMMLFVNSYT